MNNEKIGLLIQIKRKEKKLTQEELANILHVSNKTISKWETGKGMPSVDLLMPICEALDIELKELLTGKKDGSYEDLVIKTLKLKKKNKITEFLAAIFICLFLCMLEVILYIANVNTSIATIIFIVVFIALITLDLIFNKLK